jgi:hypothetical protein
MPSFRVENGIGSWATDFVVAASALSLDALPHPTIPTTASNAAMN